MNRKEEKTALMRPNQVNPVDVDSGVKEERKKWPIYSFLFKQNEPPCPEVSKDEYFHMSEMTKWKAYGRVPWKSIVHLTVIILFFIQLLSFQATAFIQSDTRDSIDAAFMKGIIEKSKFNNGVMHAKYTDSNSMSRDLSTIIKNYFTMDQSMMGVRSLPSNETQPRIRVVSYDPALTNDYFPTATRSLGDLPMCLEQSSDCLVQQRHFFMELKEMEVYFTLRTFDRAQQDCFDWSYRFRYAYSPHRAKLHLSTSHTTAFCPGYTPDTPKRPVLDMFVVTLCLISVVLSIRSLIRPYLLCCSYSRESEDFAAQPFRAKFQFAQALEASSKPRVWHLLTIAGSIATGSFSMLKSGVVIETPERDELMLLWMGVAAFFNSISLPPYFYKLVEFKHYKSIWITLQKALPQIGRVLLCFSPVMLGYVLVGTLMFGSSSSRFSTVGNSWVTLFSVANGDDIRATITLLYRNSSVIGTLGTMFIMSYMIVFIYIVMTIIISIMEQSYTAIAVQVEQERLKRRPPLEAQHSLETFLNSPYS